MGTWGPKGTTYYGNPQKQPIFSSGRGFFKDLDMPWMKRRKMRWHRVRAYRRWKEWDDERSQVGAMEGSAQAEKGCGLRLYRYCTIWASFIDTQLLWIKHG